MSHIVTSVFTVVILAFFGIGVDTLSIDCPTPRSPENGQIFLYQGGMTVKYACDPGYVLVGEVYAYCRERVWSSEAPQCVLENGSSTAPSSKTAEDQKIPYTRPLFSWGPVNSNATAKNDSEMLQDEARLHMVLYPERQRRQRIRTAALRVQSATELEEEQKKRSRDENTVPPSVIYVKKSVTPGKVVIQEDTLRRQYEVAALHLTGDPDVALVTLPRATVSTDDKGGQSSETMRQMYITAQDYLYPRQAVVDPNRPPVVVTLTESQIQWINSLHPELREQYLKDMYTTRAKEAEESARAQEFLRRYEDSYQLVYNRPYYVRQPVAVMVEDPVSLYDYTCHQTDDRGRAVLYRAPRVANAHPPTYQRRKNPNYPYNDYLRAVYRCRAGYRMRDTRFNTLHCSQRNWLGETPICDYADE